MNKKMKSTSDKFIESLSPKELKEFEEGYKQFALSELILAIMEHDEVLVRKLAKIAGVSPTIVKRCGQA
jgi:hypothetical protein